MHTTQMTLFRCAGLAGGILAAGLLAAAEPEKPQVDPVAFAKTFALRQTVRRYKPDPIPEEHIRIILDAARRGPTCMNQQPYKFLVIRDKAKIEAMKKRQLADLDKRFAEYANKLKPEELAQQKEKSIQFTSNYFTAPVYVVVLVDMESPCAGYAERHDGPIAAGYLMLAARAFGYGTAYLTDGIQDSVTKEVLNIPARYKRICVTPIGKPDGWPKQAQKRAMEEHIAWETLEGSAPLERLSYNP